MSENQIEILGTREVELLEKNHKVNLQKLFTVVGMDQLILKIENEVDAFSADISTKDGRAKIVSMAAKIAKCKSPIEKLAKEAKDESRKIIDGVNAEWKRYEMRMDELRDEIRKPVDEIEEAEAKFAEERTKLILKIESYKSESHNVSWDFSTIERFYLMRKKELCDLVEFDWQQFDFRAKGLISEALQIISDRLAIAEKNENDRIELETLKKEKAEREQKDRDDQIAKDAAAKATKDAEEKAERERQAEENKRLEAEENARNAIAEKEAAEKREKEQSEQAEKNRIAAEQKAKDAAEKAAAVAVEKERLRVAEQKRKDDEAAEKIARNKRHRTKINNEALAAIEVILGKVQDDHFDEMAKAIIEAIAKGEVPHVQINY